MPAMNVLFSIIALVFIYYDSAKLTTTARVASATPTTSSFSSAGGRLVSIDLQFCHIVAAWGFAAVSLLVIGPPLRVQLTNSVHDVEEKEKKESSCKISAGAEGTTADDDHHRTNHDTACKGNGGDGNGIDLNHPSHRNRGEQAGRQTKHTILSIPKRISLAALLLSFACVFVFISLVYVNMFGDVHAAGRVAALSLMLSFYIQPLIAILAILLFDGGSEGQHDHEDYGANYADIVSAIDRWFGLQSLYPPPSSSHSPASHPSVSHPSASYSNTVDVSFILTSSMCVLLGAWTGAYMLALDWGSYWQVFPHPCVFTACLCYVACVLIHASRSVLSAARHDRHPRRDDSCEGCLSTSRDGLWQAYVCNAFSRIFHSKSA